MRAAHALATAAMLVVGGLSHAAFGQGAGHEAHHPRPAAEAGGPAETSPGATRPGGMPGPGPGEGSAMSPGMAPMMQGMMQGTMRDMCAAMMSEGDARMAGRDGDRAAPGGPTDPVTGAFDAINRRMHHEMAVDASADPDRAFAMAMIAHHEGAIDMAKVILAFGSDPQIRSLAEQVIKAQEEEVAVLRRWLAERPAR